MTKKELIAQTAREVGLTHAEAMAVIESVLLNITKAVAGNEGKVVLPGFGTFERVHRCARKCRNPQTGEQMEIKARNAVKFKPGKKLKEAVLGF